MSKFTLNKSLEVLTNTPHVISALLNNLSDEWTTRNEGENTWTPKQVVAHLIINEKTNWLTRAKIILSDSDTKIFIPIDMEGHFNLSDKYTLPELLTDFAQLRENSLKELKSMDLTEDGLQHTAVHPKLGRVNLQQLLATWVTHDLAHIAQICRVLAKQQKELVGPFATFLRILNS